LGNEAPEIPHEVNGDPMVHLRQWFENIQHILFGIEFLLIQIYVIVHLVKTLFFRDKRRAV